MGNKVINLTGQQFSRLTVLSQAVSNKHGATRWYCHCECGNFTTVNTGSLRNGTTKSCGCYQREVARERILKQKSHNKLPPGMAAFNSMYNSYKKNARKRNLVFELTKEDFSFITKMNCHYCGIEPLQGNNNREDCNGDYIYNGIDRIDSSKGYTVENVVPCCKLCNFAKRDMELKEFINWIKRVCKYQEGKL